MTPRDVALAFWDAQRRGDPTAARALLATDVVWTVAGRGLDVAGTYTGADSFFEELLPTLGRAFEPGTFSCEVLDVFEDPSRDTAITVFRDTALARNGHAFDLVIVAVMAVENGLVTRVLEVTDLAECARAGFADARQTDLPEGAAS